MDFIVSAVLVVFLIAARFLLFRLFTNDSHVIEIGCDMLVLITPWYIVYVFIEVIAGALRGVGNVVVPVAITLLGVCVLRIACRHAENLTDDIGDYFKLSGNMGYHSACIYHLLYIHNP
jgi:Na+-driven multidrug efflux pump